MSYLFSQVIASLKAFVTLAVKIVLSIGVKQIYGEVWKVRSRVQHYRFILEKNKLFKVFKTTVVTIVASNYIFNSEDFYPAQTKCLKRNSPPNQLFLLRNYK